MTQMYAEIDNVDTFVSSMLDTESESNATDTGYGYHLGWLYQFTPDTRVGVSYHSQVAHHLSGSSKFIGPLADDFNNGPLETSRSIANLTLPAYTAFSMYHRVSPQLAMMGSILYTQWNVFKNLVLQHEAGIQDGAASTNIDVVIPAYYRNTWFFSFGADYEVSNQVTLRGGVGYDETPVRNTNRNVALPDNNHYLAALGAHYQATNCLGLDLGWMHVFMKNARVNPSPQTMGDQVVSTDGSVNGDANIFGAQITWDIV